MFSRFSFWGVRMHPLRLLTTAKVYQSFETGVAEKLAKLILRTSRIAVANVCV
jgi:hypothetical protein